MDLESSHQIVLLSLAELLLHDVHGVALGDLVALFGAVVFSGEIGDGDIQRICYIAELGDRDVGVAVLDLIDRGVAAVRGVAAAGRKLHLGHAVHDTQLPDTGAYLS